MGRKKAAGRDESGIVRWRADNLVNKALVQTTYNLSTMKVELTLQSSVPATWNVR
jgi:hypothetical protein